MDAQESRVSNLQLFPELAPAEYEALKADIAIRGVLVPVLYDQNGTLLDGHHRERIGSELGIAVPSFEVECADDAERRAVVRAVNLYRRHLTPEQWLEHYAALKDAGWSNVRIAEASGVTEGTVRNTLRRVSGSQDYEPPARVTGKDGKSYPASRPADRLAPLMTSETAEWYTPIHVIDCVVAAMGAIDLDPCADPQKKVPADQHYTKDDDGLEYGWWGRVYMNPPYGGVIGDWAEKLANEFEMGNVSQAIALVPARTDTAWFRRLPATEACFVAGRLKFSGSDTGAPFPSVALYLGPNATAFRDAFRELGGLWERQT